MDPIRTFIPVLAAVTLLHTSCAVSVQRNVRILERDGLSAQLFLPADGKEDDFNYMDTYSYMTGDSISSDTITIVNPEGKRVHFMKATTDSSGTIHATEELRAVVVTARFKNIPERNGMVRIAFDVRIPRTMLNPHWQVRLSPEAVLMDDTVRMEEVHVTGEEYRERQIRGYELYNRFLATIVTDSSELIHTGQLETFIERNIPLLAGLRKDSSIIDPNRIKGLYGISFKKAREHYLKRLAIIRNNRRQERIPDKFNRYISDPLILEGVRIDSVVNGDRDDIIYCYSQNFRTRPGLRKIDLSIGGEIFFDGECRYSIPASEPLTFYVSSFATLAENQERFITRVIERKVTSNTSAALDFRPGEYLLDETYSSNFAEIQHIKRSIDELIKNRLLDIDSLVITATCSPEGSYALNSSLAGKRGNEIARYFEKYVEEYNIRADSLEREELGIALDLNWTDEEMEYASVGERITDFDFIVKQIPEDWDRLVELIRKDSVIKDKSGILAICRTDSPDIRESILSRHSEYRYIKDNLYPALREVQFDFHLHRRGMIKDTIHTSEPDTVYYAGLQAIRDRDFKKAVQYLGNYKDLNSAVAFLAMDYNASAMQILEDLPASGKRDYLLAIAHSRNGNERKAVECFVNSVSQDPSMAFRGNLDPEISRLIEKYNLLSYMSVNFFEKNFGR